MKKAKPELTEWVKFELQERKKAVVKAKGTLAWFKKHAATLSKLPTFHFYTLGPSLDFDNLMHPDIIKVIKTFGGRWDKKLSDAASDRVDYIRDVDGMKVRCYEGEPPPNCKIVETIELVPAQEATTRVVKRLVCK